MNRGTLMTVVVAACSVGCAGYNWHDYPKTEVQTRTSKLPRFNALRVVGLRAARSETAYFWDLTVSAQPMCGQRYDEVYRSVERPRPERFARVCMGNWWQIFPEPERVTTKRSAPIEESSACGPAVAASTVGLVIEPSCVSNAAQGTRIAGTQVARGTTDSSGRALLELPAGACPPETTLVGATLRLGSRSVPLKLGTSSTSAAIGAQSQTATPKMAKLTTKISP